MKENGIKIRCMGKGNYHGQMDVIIKVLTWKIKSMDWEHLLGQTTENIMGIGLRVNNME